MYSLISNFFLFVAGLLIPFLILKGKYKEVNDEYKKLKNQNNRRAKMLIKYRHQLNQVFKHS